MKKFALVFMMLLLLESGLLSPITEKDDLKILMIEEILANSVVVHTAKHDVVKIAVQFLVLDNPPNINTYNDSNIILFFVEADLTPTGKKNYQGLYVLREGKVKKLLEHGVDITSRLDDSKKVFFASDNGIYIYNLKDNTAEKYGNVSENIIGLEKEKGTDIIYILTEDNHVCKISDGGNVKTQLDGIHNAKQIVLDFWNNLYFYNENNDIFVWNSNTIKKIEGLPERSNSIDLVRPPFEFENGILAVIDNNIHIVFANGTSTFFLSFPTNNTAHTVEAGLLHYYTYDKKIYKFDFGAIISGLVDTILKAIVKGIENRLKNI